MSEFESKSEPNRDVSEEEIISKTRLKKDALALKKFGLELAQLPAEKVNKLPIDETTRQSILDYQKITTNLAKKRQLMFIGKCLRNEDEADIRHFLTEQLNSNLKAKVIKQNPIQNWVEKLLSGDTDVVEALIQEYPLLERQTLRQLLRNIGNAKGPEKNKQATEKLKHYLNDIISLKSK